MTIYNEPPPGMCIVPDKDDMTKVCCAFQFSNSRIPMIHGSY